MANKNEPDTKIPLLDKHQENTSSHHSSPSSSDDENGDPTKQKNKDEIRKKKKNKKNKEKGSALDLGDARQSMISKALSQTFASTAHLANLLPTGTVLAFQILGPIFTNGGDCDWVSQVMTQGFLITCALWCFFVSFTDSFVGADGRVYYGVATPKGLKTFEYLGPSVKVPEPVEQYKLRFIDFVHSILSVCVFSAIAFMDKGVCKCLYPKPSTQTQEVLDVMPVAIAVVSSLIFTVFPTTRHGIGYPVSTPPPNSSSSSSPSS